MADRFLTYAAVAAGAYFLLARGAAPAGAGNGRNGLTMPFPEFAPMEPSDSGSVVAPDVIPYSNGFACCMAMTESCMECARQHYGGVTGGALGGIIERPALPPSEPSYSLSDQLRSYPDYFMRSQPGYGLQPVPY